MSKGTFVRLGEADEEFVSHYAELGFTGADEMIKQALQLLKKELDFNAQLIQSADAYAKLYEQDEEAKEWIESSLQDWSKE